MSKYVGDGASKLVKVLLSDMNIRAVSETLRFRIYNKTGVVVHPFSVFDVSNLLMFCHDEIIVDKTYDSIMQMDINYKKTDQVCEDSLEIVRKINERAVNRHLKEAILQVEEAKLHRKKVDDPVADYADMPHPQFFTRRKNNTALNREFP